MEHAESHDAWAALAWQVELGADEAILDAPVDRFAEEARAQEAKAAPAAAVVSRQPPDLPAPDANSDPAAAVATATALAEGAGTLDALRDALAGFEGCDLRHGARNLVFSDGDPRARVMVIGEAPGRDEDRLGKPFVGRAGQLLDAMFAAIGMARTAEAPDRALYITKMLPWRPPQNRDPSPDEIAMLLPFMRRHVELAKPELLVLSGNWACRGLLGRGGITKIRGQWTEALGRPALPMLHPAYLLRNPAAKREAWADLLTLQARLREGP